MRKLVVLFLLATTVLCSGCGGKNSIPSSEESTPFYIKNPTQIEAEREEARLKEEEELQHSLEREENRKAMLDTTEVEQEENSINKDAIYDEFSDIVMNTLYSDYVTLSLKYNAVAGSKLQKTPDYVKITIYKNQKEFNLIQDFRDKRQAKTYVNTVIVFNDRTTEDFNVKYAYLPTEQAPEESVATNVLDLYGFVTTNFTKDKKNDYEVTKSELGDSVTYSVRHLTDRTQNNVYGYYLIANVKNGIIETVTSANKEQLANTKNTPITINISTDKFDISEISNETEYSEAKTPAEITLAIQFGLSYVVLESEENTYYSIDELREELGLEK